MSKRMSEDEYKIRLKEVNKELIGEYIDYKSPVKIRCLNCGRGPYTVKSARSATIGLGCKKCGTKHRCSKEEFCILLNANNKELIGEYINSTAPVCVKCKLCNTIINFSASYSALRNDKCNGCVKLTKHKNSMKNLSNYDSDLIDNICNEYCGGTSMMQLASKYLFDKNQGSIIRNILTGRNINLKNHSQATQKFKINENVFDEVNTEEKAYMLGFLYADGGNVGNAVMLALHKKDDEILFRFSQILETNKPIKYYKTNTTHYGRLTITNKKLVTRFSDLGVVECKTFKIRFPTWLNENLIKPFIRGYFDGDGGLVITKTRNVGSLTITSNEDFINDLKYVIQQHIPVNCCIAPIYGTQKVDKRIKRIVISGNKQILMFLEWMYEDSLIHLTRKYDKFIQLKTNPISTKYVKQTLML